jgi:chromosome segregation ATPase
MTLKASKKSTVDDRLGKYRQAVVELESKKTGLELTVGGLEYKIDELNRQILSLEKDISKRGERIIDLSNVSREIEALVNNTKGDASKISTELGIKIKISEGIIDDKRREYDKIKADTDIMYVRLNSLVGQMKSVQSQRDDIAEETAHLRDEAGSLLTQKNRLVRDIESKKTERGSLDELYRQYNSKKIELDRREIDLGIYEKRLQKRSKDAGVDLKIKLK